MDYRWGRTPCYTTCMKNNSWLHHRSFVDKAIEVLHFPHRKTRFEKWVELLQLALLYGSLFLAGYMVAKVQMMLS